MAANGWVWQSHSNTFLGPLSTFQFDPHCDLLWTATGAGAVVSRFLNGDAHAQPLARYSSFKFHRAPVRHLLVSSRAVLCLAADSLQANDRRALPIWSNHQNIQDAHSMAFSSTKSSELVIAGALPHLQLINPANGLLLRTIQLPASSPAAFSPVTHIRLSQSLVACGALSGTITLRDPSTLKETHSFMAHYAGLDQLETEGNYLVTCGFSLKQGHPVRDPLVKVFDVRALRPLPPITFPAVPSLVRFHPRMSSTLFIASSLGRLQILDILNPISTTSFHQLDCSSYLTELAIAPSGEGLAYSDADGLLHLWTSSADVDLPRSTPLKWSKATLPIELPVDQPSLSTTPFNDETPLSTIGMPFYTTELSSVLPFQNYITPYSPLFQPRPSIDPDLLAALQHQVSFRPELAQVAYLPHPKKLRRYQATLPASSNHAFSAGIPSHPALLYGGRRLSAPLFRSEKDKEKDGKQNTQDAALGLADDDAIDSSEEMPRWYRQVEIKYSKFGVEDFDFGFYNSTKYSGLETHIVNSYTNALLQILYHTLPFRVLAQTHITRPCTPPSCILCELGFLFRSMGSAAGVNCQPTNFSKAFSANPRVLALALNDGQGFSCQRSYASLIQLCHHFLLEQVSIDSSIDGIKQGGVEDIYSTFWKTEQTCSSCKITTSRPSTTKAIELVYPPFHQPSTCLSEILSNSFSRETSSKGTCSKCGQTSILKYRRRYEPSHPLPNVLAIHAAVSTPDQLSRWTQPGFVKGELYISLSNENNELVVREQEGGHQKEMTGYELDALVVQIETAQERPHLVSLIKINDAEGWHVFNDFLVRKVSADEAVAFKAAWKIPAILYYRKKALGESAIRQDTEIDQVQATIDQSILLQDINLSERRDPSQIQHKVLSEDEIPSKGTLVAIDAEFVSLQQEEVDYRSDGTRIVRRPSRMSLARVSVLRGSGPKKGLPFIDDHIETFDPVTDYLTEFSGIRPGDLDRHSSVHTLVPLKVAYKKLRLLVDLGCRFIGHGLSKDFRIINIHVPPSQIIDTVEIYYIPSRQRKLSLRLLSFLVIGQDIQNEGIHDSIEDSKTALKLYEFWKTFMEEEDEGFGDCWSDELDGIYRKGKNLGWKVPSAK